ncbi:hypothetical protein Q4595_25255, partial [Wenyingzhuangia sp. 1_MG-2023]|nr:hypothetical protein [Wenyingzhuangia sp. 1_MG-2023]
MWSEPVLTCFSAREKAVPQALLFDLDGTLIDSVPDLAAAIDQMLVQLGQAPAGETLVAEWVGNGVDMLVRRALCQGNDLQALALDDADVAAAQALF